MKITAIQPENFQQELCQKEPGTVIIIVYWASWYPASNDLIQDLEKQFQDQQNVEIFTVSIDTNLPLFIAHKVNRIPSILLFKNNQEMARFIGEQDNTRVTKEIQRLLQ